jgi:hypothetical protein
MACGTNTATPPDPGPLVNAARWQAAVIALLGVNVAVYALGGRASEILDAAAWFVLLAAFAVAAHAPARAHRWRHPLLALRLAAGAAVLWAALRFVAEGEWLDAANAWLWIAVVIALEIELRGAASRRWLHAVTLLLYAALLLAALLWFAQGYWFEAYDALLWICAFVLVERGLIRSPYITN